MNQESALQILKSGKNVFLTGSAGAGKTYLLNQYIEYLRDRGVPLAITASTGIAATHLDGQTIHSWSGLGIKDVLTDADLQKIAKKKPLRNRLEKVQVLVIDEISMLSGQTLSCIDQILRYFKTSFKPFGGIQVVFSGDFFQLPPVSKERLSSHEKFAFMAPIWVKAELQICYLTDSYRHQKNALLELLNEIRSGEISEASADMLQEKLVSAHENTTESALKLFTHNADVDKINKVHLAKLDSDVQRFTAKTMGNRNLVEALKKSTLAPTDLDLKQYAQVIFVKNNYEMGYLNGTMGTVTDFDDEGWPIVETFSGATLVAKPVEWSIVDESNIAVASFSQVPLRLAWAITVHKSQGMTLDSAEIDLSKTFEQGQGYVALSRVKTWADLTLLGCNQKALQMDPLVMVADKRFQELSSHIDSEFQQSDAKKLQKSFDDFIERSGGTLDTKLIAQNHKRNALPRTVAPKAPKVSTYEQTRVLIVEGKNLEQIATARNVTTNTIVSHLEKLKSENSDLDITRFKPDTKLLDIVIAAIQKCKKNSIAKDFDQDGHLKLGLIHRELKGKVGYDTIRLCRVFAKKS